MQSWYPPHTNSSMLAAAGNSSPIPLALSSNSSSSGLGGASSGISSSSSSSAVASNWGGSGILYGSGFGGSGGVPAWQQSLLASTAGGGGAWVSHHHPRGVDPLSGEGIEQFVDGLVIIGGGCGTADVRHTLPSTTLRPTRCAHPPKHSFLRALASMTCSNFIHPGFDSSTPQTTPCTPPAPLQLSTPCAPSSGPSPLCTPACVQRAPCTHACCPQSFARH